MKTVQQPSPQPSAAPSRDDTSLQGKVNQVPPSSPTAPTLDDTSPYGEIKQAPLPLPAGETSPSREVPALPGETIRASEARLGFPELPQVKAMSENQPLQRTTFKVETETLSPPLPESEDRAFPPDPAIAPRQEIAPSSDLLPQPDLNREVLARTKAGTSLPLTRPFRPLQRKPADESEPPSETSLPPGWQTEETAAAEHVETEVNAENPPEPAAHPQPLRRPQALSPLARSPEETALPLAVPKEITRPDRQQGPFSARPSLSGPIQRQPVVPEATVLQPPRPVAASHESPVVQRALHDEDSPPVAVTTEASQEEQAVDLDALARQIFPRVKRMLAVERERRPFR
jgi:hypothetical protein